MEKKTRICITGGHLTPAIAVIDELQKVHPDWKIIFIGRKYALEQDTQISQEYHEIVKRGIQFFPISAGRLRRDRTFNSFLAFLRIPVGFVQSFWYMLREHPACILSFGGYVSLPVVFSGWLLGIPVMTHEQTHTLGLANRLMLPFVAFCLLSYEDTKYAPAEKSHYTGLPIRKTIAHPSKTLSFVIPSGLPIIYITGGSTGAVSMNELLFPIIGSLVTYAVVIHQTGPRSIEKAAKVKQGLPEKYRSRYIPMQYIEGIDIGWIMHHMSLLVGRSGGNTVAETALVQKPALFIPLPWSGQHEQEQNARWYEKIGAAYVADQEKETPADIQKKITELLKQKEKNIPSIRAHDRAATHIITHIELLVADNEK
jgi:UDP-N-acetylglucosamine--N-acetylmuramyl-(pentapeptide) pyrophosphoryl-undecaprenol N-acetylglucosamine transferase